MEFSQSSLKVYFFVADIYNWLRPWEKGAYDIFCTFLDIYIIELNTA